MITYNEEQLAVINSDSPCIFVVAAAGSGKTKAAIGAVEKYMSEKPQDRVAVITFTRKGAEDLKGRINVSGHVEVSTIHSWAWKRLSRLGEEYGFVVQLLEDSQIKLILKRLCMQRNHYHVNQFMLFSYVMGNYNIDIDDSLKRIYEGVRLDYEKFKRKQKLYDFTDLPLYLYDKLNEYELEIEDVDALFVDEFQDIDEIQLSLFEKVLAKKKFYIGDPRQNIYQFRSSVEDVVERLKDFEIFHLNTNYRSRQEVIDYAETVRKKALFQLENDNKMFGASVVQNIESSDIICDRGAGGEVYSFLNFSGCTDCVNGNKVSETITLRRILSDPKTQILCRSNKQVKKLQTYGFTNVSTVHQAKGLEYDNVIATDFPITNNEELNICYVAITRAKNKVATIPFEVLLNIITAENIQPTTNRLF